jgi:hypothetical protein
MIENIGTITEPKAFEQLGIILEDESLSMSEVGETGQTKSNEVNMGERGVVSRLKVSRNRDNFLLARIRYAESPDLVLKPTPLGNIDETEDFVPTDPTGARTAIGEALYAGFSLAQDWLAAPSEVPRSVVLMLLTDGQNNSGRDPMAVAQNIKASGQRIKICAAGYGKDSDVDSRMLQQIVSEPMGFVRAYDPEQLRKFFEASISRVNG